MDEKRFFFWLICRHIQVTKEIRLRGDDGGPAETDDMPNYDDDNDDDDDDDDSIVDLNANHDDDVKDSRNQGAEDRVGKPPPLPLRKDRVAYDDILYDDATETQDSDTEDQGRAVLPPPLPTRGSTARNEHRGQ